MKEKVNKGFCCIELKFLERIKAKFLLIFVHPSYPEIDVKSKL